MTPARFPKIRLFQNPFVAPGMGLGDDLVTIRVLEHPGGPTLWPLGLCSPCHGPPKSFKIAVCRWFNGIWCEHKPLKQFSTLYKSKMENFANHFFDIVTTYNDEICYVKHVLAPFYVFFTLFGCGGGGLPRGLGRNLLMQFSRLNSSKMEITSQRLLDQSQAGVYMGKTPHTPPFWLFWAYSRTLPQGVELLV